MQTITAHPHHPTDNKADQAFRMLPVACGLHRQIQTKTGVTMLEVSAANKLYSVVSRYIALHGNKTTEGHSHSWAVADTTRQGGDLDRDGGDDETMPEEKEVVSLSLGLGQHEVTHEGRLIRVVHQSLGNPIGGNCGPSLYKSLVLYIDGHHQQAALSAFCEHVLEWDSAKDDERYNIYMWKPRHQYWHKVASKRIRPIESVILPEDIKASVLDDLTEFSSRSTARWYAHHGIPYKRSLLFSGPPGAGKSSLITALAGHLGRNVCFLQAAHPEITDDNLQTCVQGAPARSLIVLEDIDALFDENRESKAKNGGTPLTFSGLLNALDGVCNPEGQVFILTTNHIERLDPALIRPGRVDLRVHFTTATREQATALFRHFYPDAASTLAEQFAGVIAERYPAKEEGEPGLGLSMAALQQLFIVCRRNSADEALERARTFVF